MDPMLDRTLTYLDQLHWSNGYLIHIDLVQSNKSSYLNRKTILNKRKEAERDRDSLKQGALQGIQKPKIESREFLSTI